MTKQEKIAITLSTAYVLVFIGMLHAGSEQLVWLMFALSPLVILATAYTILRHGQYTGRDLDQNEEWAYGDKKKEDLGVF